MKSSRSKSKKNATDMHATPKGEMSWFNKPFTKISNAKYFDLILLGVIILLSLGSILPLFSSGFFPMHDDTQVARVSEMKNALMDGMLPVRWSENLGYGYGYPIFNFYAPFIYYVGAFFNLIGFDALISTKVMIGLGMLLSGIGMFLFAKNFWGRIGGIISALLYVYAPYHAVNLYVRGAISELWAYGILPFVFLGIYKLFLELRQEKLGNSFWLWFYFTALSYAALICSHNLTAMMISPFLLIFIGILFIVSQRNKKQLRNCLLFASMLFGIVLSAFYWLPALFEMRYTNVMSIIGGGSDYPDHFVCLMQLWSSPWGFAGSAPGCIDGVSFKLGKMHILLSLLAFIPLLIPKIRVQLKTIIVLAYAGAFLSLFLLVEYAKPVWDLIPQMAYFQFPWRFLLMANFFIALLGGAIFIALTKRMRLLIGAIAVVMIIFINVDMFVPSKSIAVTSEELTDKAAISWKVSKISDEYMPPLFAKPTKPDEVPKEKLFTTDSDVNITLLTQKTGYIHAEVTAPQATTVQLAIAYFPAWQIFIDDKRVPYTRFDQGLKVKIPKGTHKIEAVFTDTPVEMIGNSLTLTGVMVIFAGIIAQRKDKKRIAKVT